MHYHPYNTVKTPYRYAKKARLILCLALWGLQFITSLLGAGTLPLGLEFKPGNSQLVVGQMTNAGALFIFTANDLSTFVGANSTIPSIIFQTNTPLLSGLRLAIPSDSSVQNQAFYVLSHWPGRSVAEFGDPEYLPSQPSPAMVLVTSGQPSVLAAIPSLALDFFVTDPAGNLVNISMPAQIVVIRRLDGAIHPDAQVTPSTWYLIGGRLRAQINLQATTSLDGFTLGLIIQTNSPQSLTLSPTVNLGQSVLPNPTAEAVRQGLYDLRHANVDADASWSCPLLPATNFLVSGVYGEWRGKDNRGVHTGLDLTPTMEVSVVASRGGIISYYGALAGIGGHLVIDHGDSWFSCYSGLEVNSVVVVSGQIVARGARLANRLLVSPGMPVRLHFEVRQGADLSQWGVSAPSVSSDPLQAPGIFGVPAGFRPPQMDNFGLTRCHPAKYPFVKSPPGLNQPPGMVYLFASFVDLEPGPGGVGYRLGLRSLAILPEGASGPMVFQPVDDSAVAQLVPSNTNATMGFACYGPLHAAIPDPLNWFRYWCAWNTSAYADDPKGPRSLQLSGQGFSGLTTNYYLSFGPEIKNVTWEPIGSGQYLVTIAAHLGANSPQLVQPDQYLLEALRADKTIMPGIHWEGTEPGNLSKVFFTHLEQVNYILSVPAEVAMTNLIIRASSLLVPDLRHEFKQSNVIPVLADIPPGSFLMGSPATELLRASWEGPQTLVALTNGFKMGKYEVTQGEYQAFMTNNPSYFSGDPTRPVEQVTWAEAMEYCRRLTDYVHQAGLAPIGWAFRLPTEAEWEYACRAGTTTPFHYGPALRSGMANFDGVYEYDASLGEVVNLAGVHLWRTIPIGTYAPNVWGLYDMHGNVWEWCLDHWSSSLPGGSVINPQGPSSGSDRVIRGGCWYNDAQFCRSAYRLRSPSDYRENGLGFRVVLAPILP